jgi:uncharacterized protein (DUF2237 family)
MLLQALSELPRNQRGDLNGLSLSAASALGEARVWAGESADKWTLEKARWQEKPDTNCASAVMFKC